MKPGDTCQNWRARLDQDWEQAWEHVCCCVFALAEVRRIACSTCGTGKKYRKFCISYTFFSTKWVPIRKCSQKTNKKMLKKFVHVLNLVFEKKMQHPEYFQHVFREVENKLNLVYLGILVHTQCKIVHTLNWRTNYSVISLFFATKSSATNTPHLNYLNYINYLPKETYLKSRPVPLRDPPAPHPTLTT